VPGVVVSDFIVRDLDPGVGHEPLRVEIHVLDARRLVLLLIDVQNLRLGDRHPAHDLLLQLADRERPSELFLVLRPGFSQCRIGQRLAVLLDVELAIRLEGRQPGHLWGWIVADVLHQLAVGEMDVAALGLVAQQRQIDRVLPGLLLDLPQLVGGQPLVAGSLLGLLVEDSILVLILLHRDLRAIDRAQPGLVARAGAPTGKVHPPLEYHEPDESDRGQDHDDLGGISELLHHGACGPGYGFRRSSILRMPE
jgi:hypothetical protein